MKNSDIIIALSSIVAKNPKNLTDEERNAFNLTINIIKDNVTLKHENAALRERLERAVELPRLEISPYDDNDTLLYYLENGHIRQECFNNKHPEQLQKRLAELKGDKNDR